MYIILVYDVKKDKARKVLKICRKYLIRVQNSVFEGYLTEKKLDNLKLELFKVIDSKYDSLIIYKHLSVKYLHKEEIGTSYYNDKII